MSRKSTPVVQGELSYGELVGQVLRQAREAKKIDQATMASHLGISQSAYSRLETGRSALTMAQLRTAASAMGLWPSQVLGKADQLEDRLRKQGVRVVSEKDTSKEAAALIGLGLLLALLAK